MVGAAPTHYEIVIIFYSVWISSFFGHFTKSFSAFFHSADTLYRE